MQFNTKIIGQKYEVSLEGNTENVDCKRIVELTQEFIKSTCDTMVLDFGKVILLDSMGVSMILLARNELTGKENKTFILRHPLGKVRHMFQLFNIDKLVKVEW